MTHVDTSLLIDLLREDARSSRGPATRLLENLAGEEVRVGVHVICELLAGAELSRRPVEERARVQQLCTNLDIAYPDEEFAET